MSTDHYVQHCFDGVSWDTEPLKSSPK